MVVHGFLGVCCIIWIWVKDFTKHARPLVILTKKEMDFVWGPEQRASMEDLKQVIITAPCLWLIDYRSDQCVILVVNSSCIATGFILLQLGADNKCYPSHFGSITWNERESHYSQEKIEIYGLWCALQAYMLYTISVKSLELKSMQATSRECSIILIFNLEPQLIGGLLVSSSSSLS